MYVMPEWFHETSSVVSKIDCFITDFQEPYLLMKVFEGMVLFDERFVNYGYNKVQFFEHLRSAGYSFYILNNAYAMDLPHPDSKLRSMYIASVNGEGLKMKQRYSVFQEMLSKKYANATRFPVCPTYKNRYYVRIEFCVCYNMFSNRCLLYALLLLFICSIVSIGNYVVVYALWE